MVDFEISHFGIVLLCKLLEGFDEKKWHFHVKTDLELLLYAIICPDFQTLRVCFSNQLFTDLAVHYPYLKNTISYLQFKQKIAQKLSWKNSYL